MTVGVRHWVRGYLLMLRFDLSSQRTWLPLSVALQLLLGAAMAVVYGFYVPDLPEVGLLYLVTGAPTVALIPVGLVMVPALVGQQRTAGTFDFTWSLPVPRTVTVASTLTVATLIAVPGVAVTLLLVAWRYGVDLSFSPAFAVAVPLTCLMTSSVGLGLAHAIGNPIVVNLISNVLIVVVLLYSPIAFPIEQFPDWLAAVHEVLPLYHMGVVVRAGLTEGLVGDVGTSYAVVAAWTAAGWAATALAMRRRA